MDLKAIKSWSDLEKVTTVEKVKSLLIKDAKDKAYRQARNEKIKNILAQAKAQGITG